MSDFEKLAEHGKIYAMEEYVLNEQQRQQPNLNHAELLCAPVAL